MKKHSNIITQSIENYKDIGFPKEDETIHYVTKRAFNAISILHILNDKYRILELTIVVYSITKISAIEILNIAKKNNIVVNIVISDIRNTAFEKKEIAIKLFEENKKYIKLIYAGSHAKIILVKTENKNLCISSSANLGSNSRIEQYIIDDSKILYQFHKDWINELNN